MDRQGVLRFLRKHSKNYTVNVTITNVRDVAMTADLLAGEETVHCDSLYLGSGGLPLAIRKQGRETQTIGGRFSVYGTG